jgi:hypothetical protein
VIAPVRGQEYGIAANDVPLTHIICRTRPLDAPAGSGPPRRTPKAVIDHIAFTVADFGNHAAHFAGDQPTAVV